ncbi:MULTISPECIES: type IV pilus secretin PilQ [Acinetobacter]|uniref:type IV pilus secretin PilQ n=1 Tax=Acinetobacter TaxID=469 RepID=UPI00148722D4|nr:MULTISPECIES: type IV pilus secretin PilQ family protein [Acinetobacter]MBA0157054.1 type IV pilus secretin PilQ family protein [Acinetobacter indicus]MDM1291546.1 type IV pilus secretin PilQ family protein [Acinetobacter indicus]MDM1321471.1 type IV pilus secretin PilQ family protein [Acinetobacter indicus]MDM1333138.1 type IV pilus secretin PilQ family protein [Acinetobacter indicus]
MNNLFRQFSMGAVAMAVMQVANAQVSITNIVPMQIPGQGTEIRVMFNGLPPQPAAYQLEQPSRLVLDFDKAQQSLKQASIPVATREASSVDVSSDAQRARLTVNLAEAGAFTTRVEGNTFILKINSTQAAATPVAVQQTAQGISNIGFQRGAEGEGQVVIDLAGSNTPVDVQQQGSKIIVRTLGNKIPAHLARRLNVNDFATPVSTIDAQNDGGNGVITIQSAGSYEYMAYQAENKLTISLKRPVDKNPFKPRAAQSYTGKKISLDFQDIEVRRVLQLLADFTGINMVAADTVQGNITLRLKDVPWDQALDIILKTKNLDKRRNGNVIWIAPVAELIKAEEEEAKAIAQSVKLAPLQTEYIQLNYAKAADIEKLITDGKNASNSRGGTNSGSGADPLGDSVGSLLSPRGTVSVDPRTNTLIINDTAQKIDQIRGMIDLLDVSVKQVMIEARIVRATTDFTKEMGVKWGILSQGIMNNNHLLVGGSDTTLWNLREPEFDDERGGYTYEIERPQNLNVDLGVTSPGASRIAFGLISLSDFMLDLELSALQADGYGEVISTPKVLTADKQQAKVASGTQIPYQSAEGGGVNAVSTTEFIDATLSLDVTPSITPDGKVQMNLNITSDSPGAPTPTGQLTINKNSINTNVLVDNGETVVLGGIFEQQTANQQTKVPFLGDIPYLGRLFRKDIKSDNKRELLIFVTPRIVNDSVSRNH